MTQEDIKQVQACTEKMFFVSSLSQAEKDFLWNIMAHPEEQDIKGEDRMRLNRIAMKLGV